MSKALQPVAGVGRALFELDRFELVDHDHYEVVGRWSGVRGRRFMRPALTILVQGRPIRLLADLAHKPWAAEDGETWIAAFPCRFEASEADEAELTVAPDITIPLAAPARGGRPARTPRPAPPPDAEARSATQEAGPNPQAELRRLRHRLDRAQADKARLKADKARLAADRARLAARMDELLGELSEAIRAREEAQSASAGLKAELEELRRELTEITGQRDSAQAERDRLAAECDSLARAREEALQARQADGLRRDAALAERDHTLAERDAALAERDAALAERTAALAAREEAIRQRDAASAALAELQAQRAHEASSLGAAMVMRRAVQTPPAFRRSAPILPLAVAAIVLLAAVLAILIVLHIG